MGADSRPKDAKKISAPPAEFNSAPGAEQTRGEAENLIIPRETFNDRSLRNLQLTVLFFCNAMHFLIR